MSDDAKWILGVGIPIILALAGVIWTMLNRRIESIWDQIGRNSESGMRKTVHDSSNRSHEALMLGGDNGRRIERLERKIYNGHRPEHER